jgi:hypothetical protein
MGEHAIRSYSSNPIINKVTPIKLIKPIKPIKNEGREENR